MSELPITDAERKIMEVLWQQAPLNSAAIAERALRHEDWSPKTVQTLIGRLVQKNMIAREPAGRGYRYRPAVAREDYVAERGLGLIQRLFHGRVTPLVAAFAEHRDLAPADLAELRELVDQLERRHPSADEGDCHDQCDD
ncbi:MAG: BlaI/MecI/CopY family transcriptional regulator [Wenzhouxiangellaceae bacterium]